MAVCCQNLTLGALSSRSALSVLVGALFKEFGLFLNMPRMFLKWGLRPFVCWYLKEEYVLSNVEPIQSTFYKQTRFLPHREQFVTIRRPINVIWEK